MKLLWWLALGLLLALSGCAPGYYAAPYTEPYDPCDVPRWEDPWGFCRDPNLRHFGTMPYYNPYLQ